jgi:hypothetical protein
MTVFAVLLLVVAGFVFYIFAPDSTAGLRKEATRNELLFEAVALDFSAPDICRKISPRLYHGAGFDSLGSRVSYNRSACLMDVAVKMKNSDLCAEVRRIDTFWATGKYVSEDACREAIKSNVSSGPASPQLTDSEWKQVFEEMGFDPLAKAAEYYRENEPERAPFLFYLQLKRNETSETEEFLNKVRALAETP